MSSHHQLSNISFTDEDSAANSSSDSDVDLNISAFRNIEIADDEEYQELQQSVKVLKEQVREKDVLIENLKNGHLAEVMEMQEQLKRTVHEKKMLELKLENDLKEYFFKELF